MTKAEVTAENRPAYHSGQCMWNYTTCRTHNYKRYIQVFVAHIHKIQSVHLDAPAFLTAEGNVSRKNKIMESQGTHFAVVFSRLVMTDIAETH